MERVNNGRFPPPPFLTLTLLLFSPLLLYAITSATVHHLHQPASLSPKVIIPLHLVFSKSQHLRSEICTPKQSKIYNFTPKPTHLNLDLMNPRPSWLYCLGLGIHPTISMVWLLADLLLGRIIRKAVHPRKLQSSNRICTFLIITSILYLLSLILYSSNSTPPSSYEIYLGDYKSPGNLMYVRQHFVHLFSNPPSSKKFRCCVSSACDIGMVWSYPFMLLVAYTCMEVFSESNWKYWTVAIFSCVILQIWSCQFQVYASNHTLRKRISLITIPLVVRLVFSLMKADFCWVSYSQKLLVCQTLKGEAFKWFLLLWNSRDAWNSFLFILDIMSTCFSRSLTFIGILLYLSATLTLESPGDSLIIRELKQQFVDPLEFNAGKFSFFRWRPCGIGIICCGNLFLSFRGIGFYNFTLIMSWLNIKLFCIRSTVITFSFLI